MIPLGYFDYVCQDDLVCKVEIQDVPYFNAPIFLENKEQIGKIDEIFGNLRDYYVSVKLGENLKASSLSSKQKVGSSGLGAHSRCPRRVAGTFDLMLIGALTLSFLLAAIHRSG